VAMRAGLRFSTFDMTTQASQPKACSDIITHFYSNMKRK